MNACAFLQAPFQLFDLLPIPDLTFSTTEAGEKEQN